MKSCLPWSLIYLLISSSPLLISVFHLCCHAFSHTDVLFPPLEFCNTVPDFPPLGHSSHTFWAMIPCANLPPYMDVDLILPLLTPNTRIPHHSYPVWCLTPPSSLPLFEADFLTHLGSGLPPRPFPCPLCWWPFALLGRWFPKPCALIWTLFSMFLKSYFLYQATSCQPTPSLLQTWVPLSKFSDSVISCQAALLRGHFLHSSWALIPRARLSPYKNAFLTLLGLPYPILVQVHTWTPYLRSDTPL